MYFSRDWTGYILWFWTAYNRPPWHSSWSALWYFVKWSRSSTYLFSPVPSNLKSSLFNSLKFSLPLLQKYSIKSRKILFCSPVGVFKSRQLYNFPIFSLVIAGLWTVTPIPTYHWQPWSQRCLLYLSLLFSKNVSADRNGGKSSIS